jgi:hypothetical protein
MDITEFTVRISIIFIPGLITQTLIESLTYAKKSDIQEIISKSLMYGFVNYYIYYLLSKLSFLKLDFSFTSSVVDPESAIDFNEIFVSAGVGILLGLILSSLINSELVVKFMRLLNVTKNAGSQDVWMTVLDNPIHEWVRVRNRKDGLIYEGKVVLYSRKGGKDELFLKEVVVYSNKTGKELWLSGIQYAKPA